MKVSNLIKKLADKGVSTNEMLNIVNAIDTLESFGLMKLYILEEPAKIESVKKRNQGEENE